MPKVPLTMKNGVTPSSLWLPKGTWLYLIDFLCEQFPHIAKAEWAERMERGEVASSSGQLFTSHCLYQAEQRLYYYRELKEELEVPFEHQMLFENDELLVVDKPHFLPVIPSGQYLHQTLLVRLRKVYNNPEIAPLHRLDRETAGVVLFSKNAKTSALYHDLFACRKVNKTYHALAPKISLEFPLIHKSRMVSGEPYYRMCEEGGKPNSETEITLLDSNDCHALYQLKPITGKKHQLRVHMASLGMPILNDPLYPDLLPHKGHDFSMPVKLLAKSIAFIDPVSQKERCFTSQRSLNL